MQKKLIVRMMNDVLNVNVNKKSIYYSLNVIEHYSNGIKSPLKKLNEYLERHGMRYFLVPCDSKKIRIVKY